MSLPSVVLTRETGPSGNGASRLTSSSKRTGAIRSESWRGSRLRTRFLKQTLRKAWRGHSRTRSPIPTASPGGAPVAVLL